MKEIRESEWFGLERPTVKVSPHTDRWLRPVRVVFAGTPEVALPALDAIAGSEPRAGRRRHPPRRAVGPGPQAGRQPGRRARRGARRAGAQAGPPARPGVPGRAARPAARLPARWSPTAPCCPSRRSTSPSTAGSTCTSRCLPAWRGAAPVQHAIWAGDEVTGATTFRIVKELDAGPTYGVMTERIRPDDTAGDLLARLAEGGAGLLVATLDGIADGSLEAREQPADGRELRAQDRRRGRRDRLERASGRASTAGSGRARRRPGAWSTHEGERIKLGPVRPVPDADGLAPGELRDRQARRAGRHRHRPGAARRGQGVRQEADARGRLGARGCATTQRPRFGDA